VQIDAIKSAMKRAGVMLCMECGKCTSTCPVALVNPDFSPRKIVSRTITGGGISMLDSQLVWNCLTCNLCNDHCPSDVAFADFIRSARALAELRGSEIPCAHGGAMQSIMRLMTSPDMKQNRLDWLTKDINVASTGEILYFTGCLPYYDAYFDELSLQSTNIAHSTVKVMNKLGIIPAISSDERCCGHDLFWSGEDEMFAMLAKRNVEMIKKSGAKTIVATCAECFNTLKNIYPKFEDFPFEVLHFSQFIGKNQSKMKFASGKEGLKVTYHDPCRLSRHAGVIDEPRSVLGAIEGVEFREMTHHGMRSNCCGTSSWMNCNMFSKMLQASRLKEAKDTGAELLITACPKCMIHFKCAQKDPANAGELSIDIKDLSEFVSESLQGDRAL